MNAVDQRSTDDWIDVFGQLFQRLFDRLHAAGWFTQPVDAYVDARNGRCGRLESFPRA